MCGVNLQLCPAFLASTNIAAEVGPPACLSNGYLSHDSEHERPHLSQFVGHAIELHRTNVAPERIVDFLKRNYALPETLKQNL